MCACSMRLYSIRWAASATRGSNASGGAHHVGANHDIRHTMTAAVTSTSTASDMIVLRRIFRRRDISAGKFTSNLGRVARGAKA